MSKSRRTVGALAALAFALLACGAALAHEEQPLLVTLTEASGGTLLVSMNASRSTSEDNWPIVELAGRTVSIQYPIARPAVATVIRVVHADGAQRLHILRPDETSWTVPVEPGATHVAREYLELGVRHIWSGVDHLLFVSGLLLLAAGWRRVVLAVTGFTLGHSITLAFAALGMIRAPVAPAEAAIALSIVFLARELCDRRTDTLAKQFPIVVAVGFGLLHGFGFASALSETGLPREHVAIGLLFFNAGVEVGQVLFVGLMFALAALVRAMTRTVTAFEPWRPHVAGAGRPSIAAYALGIAGAYWFVQRGVALL